MQGKRLTIVIGEADTWHHRPLHIAILERLRRGGFVGATVVRGVAGFGGRGPIKSEALEVGGDLPLCITVVDTADRIEAMLPELTVMLAGGIVTIEDVDVRFFAGLFAAGFPDTLVGDVMAKNPESARPDTPIVEVVTRLLARGYTALPVIDDGGVVVGIIDEAQLLERGLTEMSLAVHKVIGAALVDEYLRRLAARDATVASAMVPTPTVTADQPLRTAARLLHASGRKRVPVVDAGGRLIGMLGRLDILASVAASHAHPLVPRAALPLAHRTVADIMDRAVPTVTEDVGLLDVLDRLLASEVRRVVVIDGERRPVGILTDTDLAARVNPEDRPSLLTVLRSHWNDAARQRVVRARGHRAGDLMSRPVVTVAATAPVAEALAITVARHIKALPVVDERGVLAGMAARPSLLAAALDLTS
jgi:CBS domain-containing protein